ncbi:MAG: class I adenylate-forming enzyme family protein [Polaromonas sp.]|uniref:class I adenylate-forming enzyme family protein n=1 Tax=Polaromonas sp. TaxID=1869339 RepID=UPI002488C629|nr:class I adenylate-forming enzyme family protein [Polaromonas sp.]MDI1239712.1 class I adenylate-forming enzyme family protein [Polaromonas sp.]
MILVSPQKIDEYTHAGWWGTTTLWDLFVQHRRERPDAQAVADACNRADFAHGAPRSLTWAQLGDEVDRFCLLLLDSGLTRDDVLVVQLPNCVEQFVVYLACARLGLIVTPVPVQYRDHELEHILEVTRARAAVTFTRIGKPTGGHAAAAMFVGLAVAHPDLRLVLAWGDAVPASAIDIGARTSAALTDDARSRLAQAERDAAVTANDVFTVCWTSGTEAQPKGVPRSHNEWLIIAPSIIEAAQIPQHARLLNPFALVNMAGISTAFVTWLALGGTVVQHQPFTLPVFLQQLREERIDYTVAPPAILNMLLQNAALLEGIDFKRLSRIGSGSAPLSDWMVRGFAEQYGVQIINYFGSNEGAALSGNAIDIPEPELRAQFFPRAGVPGHAWSVSTTRKIRTRLVDLESGEDITVAGLPGELRFSGPTIFSGYFGAPAFSARAFDAQGFYKTGDLFEIAGDRLQYYHYVGRSKDLVMRGGVNISSEEVENLLLACPGVREAAVVAVPDPTMGEKLCACVVAAEGQSVTLQSIAAYLRDEKRVAIYKVPEYLLLLPSLPRNPVGKILKRELRGQAAQLAPQAQKVAA